MLSAWNNIKLRNAMLQIIYVGGFVAVIATLIVMGRTNLQAQGIISGFDFLWKSTGWDVNFSLIDFSARDPYWLMLVVGILNTLFLGTIGLVLATVIGVIIGMARTTENDLARLLGAIYVEVFRNIPLIVQVFFWYAIVTRFPGPRQAINLADSFFLSSRGLYGPGLNITGLSAFLGIVAFLAGLGVIIWISAAQKFRRMDPARKTRLRWLILLGAFIVSLVIFWIGRIPDTALVSMPALKGLNFRGGIRISTELSAMAISIAIYGGAYIAEIVRGGFNSVGRGQIEAAKSVGLTKWQVFSRVRFPLALRAMLPILTNQYVWLIKATTMGIAIGFADFFMVVSTAINQSGQTLELLGILMGGFLVINFSLAAILNRINRAIALKGNQLRS
nr:ABC transporter permease subunit [uncultured Roseovarius sp.]